jgi:peptidoglycan/LPS O-acetylase OafA/YrhL
VQQVIVIWLGKDAPLALQLALSVAITIVLATASWYAIEAPVLRLKPRGAKRRREIGVEPAFAERVVS